MWGDYPELDFGLAAFVVGAITLGGMDVVEAKSVLGVVGDKGERVAYRHDEPTKSGDVLLGFGKYIEIPDPSPQIEELPSLLHIPQVLCSNSSYGCHRGKPTHASSSGAQKAGTGFSGGPIKIETSRQWSVTQITTGMHRHALRRSIAAILPDRTEPPIVLPNGGTLPKWGNASGENKCTFVSNQRFSGQFCLLSGGPPERNGEGGNDNGSQSSNHSFVGL